MIGKVSHRLWKELFLPYRIDSLLLGIIIAVGRFSTSTIKCHHLVSFRLISRVLQSPWFSASRVRHHRGAKAIGLRILLMGSCRHGSKDYSRHIAGGIPLEILTPPPEIWQRELSTWVTLSDRLSVCLSAAVVPPECHMWGLGVQFARSDICTTLLK